MKINNYKVKNTKYEVIKSILIVKLINKYKHIKKWIEIFPELEYEENLTCSIYFVNLKQKKEIIYQIINKQEELNKFKQTDTEIIGININNFTDDIKQIESKIEEII